MAKINPLIIANWKMNLTPSQSLSLAKEMKKNIKDDQGKDVVFCPSFSSLESVSKIFAKTRIALGAQDVFYKDNGAFTGEESIFSLKELGCRYVIVGHSERRKYLNETNEIINKKIAICIDNGLVPVLCIGETLEQRHEGKTENVLWNQLNQCLSGIEIMPSEQIVIAYEPIWAIGTGESISPNDAAKIFSSIYQNILDLWPLTIAANNVRILYGGSVDSQIAAELSKIDKINGFLVGGTSLNSEEFPKIIKNIS